MSIESLSQQVIEGNARKYDDYTTNNGYERSEAIRMCKVAWEAQGSDKAFSHVYLDILCRE